MPPGGRRREAAPAVAPRSLSAVFDVAELERGAAAFSFGDYEHVQRQGAPQPRGLLAAGWWLQELADVNPTGAGGLVRHAVCF